MLVQLNSVVTVSVKNVGAALFDLQGPQHKSDTVFFFNVEKSLSLQFLSSFFFSFFLRNQQFLYWLIHWFYSPTYYS